jgi:putative ABC transport system permease protein
MNILWQDLRYAFRLLHNNPGFTVVALLSLALGIGANASMCSIVDSILFRPLPYSDPDRLFMIWVTAPKSPGGRSPATPANYAALRERTRSFEDIGAVRHVVSANFDFGADSSAEKDTISGQQFSASLAKVLGVNPVVGRWFTETEASHGTNPVVVLGYRLWQSRFGGARDILSKTVRIDGKVSAIIGSCRRNLCFLTRRQSSGFLCRWIVTIRIEDGISG